KITEERENKCEPARTDGMFPRLHSACQRRKLEEFVHDKSERDQCCGSPDPRHHCALVSEPGPLERQLVTDRKLCCTAWHFPVHLMSPVHFLHLILSTSPGFQV